ncbi:MAG: hypothetical protein V9E81_03100 [Marmoricola sp.]
MASPLMRGDMAMVLTATARSPTSSGQRRIRGDEYAAKATSVHTAKKPSTAHPAKG